MGGSSAAWSLLLVAGCVAEPLAAATVRVDATGEVRARARVVEATWIRAPDRRVVRHDVVLLASDPWPLEWTVDSELLGARGFYLVLRAAENDAPGAPVVSRQLLLTELREGEHSTVDVVLVEATAETEIAP